MYLRCGSGGPQPVLLVLDVDMVTESENISPVERNPVLEVLLKPCRAADVADETSAFISLA